MNATAAVSQRTLEALQRMVDRPAREALVLGRAQGLGVVAPAFLGLALIACSTMLGGLLGGPAGLRIADGALFALVEALAVAFPMLLVMSNVAGLRLTPATLIAGGAISLGVAGVVSALMLPLLGFLSLCAGDGSPAAMLRALLVPLVALCSVVGVLARILRSADGGLKTGAIVWAFALLAAAGLCARLHSVLPRWS